jgi:hypothetical protein
MLSDEPLLTKSLVPLAFGLFERCSRVAVFSTRPPVASTRGGGSLKVGARRFRRLPESSALKPLHLCVGMTLLQTTQSGKQIFAIGCPE